MTGQDVAYWQRAIGVTADGVFGPMTEAATKAWQASRGLAADGVVGPLTWAEIEPPPTSRAPAAERLVATQRTPLSMSDVAGGILKAWPEATKVQAGVLWAQFAIECADGRSCWNYNLGNVKHVAGDGHDYVYLAGVWEGVTPETARKLIAAGEWEIDTAPEHVHAVPAGKVAIRATTANPGTWFVAYPSLEDGVKAFLDYKRSPTSRYHAAWAYVLTGDPQGFARTLGRLGYFTASADVYARAMRAKFDAWMRSAAFEAVAGGAA